MKNILHARSRRYGLDGWALKHKNDTHVWQDTVCTTRQEARELKAQQLPELRKNVTVVKVSIHVTEVEEVSTCRTN
jgi:hypothetical protein